MRRFLAATFLWLAIAGLSPAVAQFADQATWAGTGGGTANAQTATVPNVGALADLLGVQVRFIAGATNTGATTLAITGTTATAVRKRTGAGIAALTGNEIVSGQVIAVLYDGTFYQLVSPVFPAVSTTQVLTTGTSATYNQTAPGARQIRVRMVGGGGGGAAVGVNSGSDGTATIFNSITANPGIGGLNGGTTTKLGGLGGTGGSGSATLRRDGNPGESANFTTGGSFHGGNGGSSLLGSGGRGGAVNGTAGTAAQANSGGGGGGGGSGGGPGTSGAGGGGGEYVELIIINPAASYTYTIGTGGAGGAAGTFAGAAGGSGVIIVEEFYRRCQHIESELIPANDNEDEVRCAA